MFVIVFHTMGASGYSVVDSCSPLSSQELFKSEVGVRGGLSSVDVNRRRKIGQIDVLLFKEL